MLGVRLAILVFMFLFPPLGNTQAEYFEGILHGKAVTKGKTDRERIYFKGPFVRIEVIPEDSPGFAVILNTEKNSYILLRHSEETAYQDSIENGSPISGKREKGEKVSYKRTGLKKNNCRTANRTGYS